MTVDTHIKIADALTRVKQIADARGAHIIKSSEINRVDRELLIRTQWLQEIIKGWYLLTRPDVASGDSAAWYANFWDFLRVYLNNRFGKDYCLSAESSLELHIGETVVPAQVVVIVKQGGSTQQLPFKTSLLIYSDAKNLPTEKKEINGLQVMSLPFALCKVTPTYYQKCSENVEIALRSVRTSSELTNAILRGEFKSAAERIIGGYEFFGLKKEALEIRNDLMRAGMLINASNPFLQNKPHLSKKFQSPYAARIELLWKKYQETIIDIFPKETGLPKNAKNYLAEVNALYEYDAYNSLSIEGYQVSTDLIQRVQKNSWNPDLHEEDYNQRNALAARGYFEAFRSVKKSLTKILKGQSPGNCIQKDLSVWYQNLFAPCARAGIISHADLLGFRNDRVFIRNSQHVPPPKEAVLDSMDVFFQCLATEKSACVRAILGHYIFVFIHPYMDGNGRIARFILNIMLASGGYPWSVVQVARRKEYIDALETVHTKSDIEPFVRFIIDEMKISKKLLK